MEQTFSFLKVIKQKILDWNRKSECWLFVLFFRFQSPLLPQKA